MNYPGNNCWSVSPTSETITSHRSGVSVSFWWFRFLSTTILKFGITLVRQHVSKCTLNICLLKFCLHRQLTQKCACNLILALKQYWKVLTPDYIKYCLHIQLALKCAYITTGMSLHLPTWSTVYIGQYYSLVRLYNPLNPSSASQDSLWFHQNQVCTGVYNSTGPILL